MELPLTVAAATKQPLGMGTACSSQQYHTGTKCTAVGPDHPSWNAVVDNYVYIHNAFRNHLEYIISLSSQQSPEAVDELAKWASILKVHTAVEDDLFMPGLEYRGFKVPEYVHAGHRRVEEACTKAMASVPGPEAQRSLVELKEALMQHLDEEENCVMPAMVDKFSTSSVHHRRAVGNRLAYHQCKTWVL